MGVGVSSPRIVGRDQELAALVEALSRATTGEPGIVLIAGAAGIGKSRLVAEFAARASAQGARVFVGDCLDLVGGGLPFGPVAAILRDFARTTDAARLREVLGPARTELVRLVPEMDVPGEADTHSGGIAPVRPFDLDLDPDQARTRILEHLLAVFGRLASEATAVVVLEDVHWIDSSTRDLVSYLAHNLRAERLLLLLTSRSEHLERTHPHAAWLADLTRSPRTQTIALEPLAADETAIQLGAILGRDVEPGLASQVHHRSEGNALFNEELLAAIRSGSSTLPVFLSDALGAKIRSLPAQSVEVLAVAAIASRSFDERLIAAVLGGAEDDFLRPIRDAVMGHVLMAGPSSYRFRHGLFAEAIVADLTPGERRSLHARIAAALEARPDLAEGGPAWVAGEAADHWLAADRPSEAFRSALAAGFAASLLHAHGVALERWEQALLLSERVDPATRTEVLGSAGLQVPDLLMRTAQVAALTGEHDRARTLAEQALLPRGDDPDAASSGVMRSDYARILWAAGHFERAHEVFREAAELVAATGSVADRARVMGRYALILLFQSQLDEGVAVARDAVAAARQAGLPAVEAEALDALGNGLRILGSFSEAIVHLREAREVALRSGDIEEQLFVSDSLAECLIDADQLDEAVTVAKAAADDAQGFGLDRTFGAMFRGNGAMALFGLGRWAEAEAMTRTGMDVGYGRVWGLCVRGRLLAAMGRPADARGAMASVEAMFPEGLPDLARLEVALTATEQQLLEGNPDGALATVLAALDIALPHVSLRLDLAVAGLRAAADLTQDGRVRRDEGALSSARAAAERCMAEVVEQQRLLGGWDSQVASKVATALQAEAELARLEGRPDPDRWAAIAEGFAAVPMPYPSAYACHRQAEALLTLGGVKAPVGDLLRAAHETCRDIGAVPLAASIERLARQARVDLATRPVVPDVASVPTGADAGGLRWPASPTAKDLGLSLRELQVLSLVAAGRTNGQIAGELFISPKTASVHVTHILDKLGASNRAEAAMIAERAGLLDSGPGSQGEQP